MKFLKILGLLIVPNLLVLGLILSGCKKEEIPGPKGDPGDHGIGGNSNIVSSAIVPITSSQWKPNTDTTMWLFKLDAPLVTAEIAQTGVVKVFVETGNAWWELPYLEGESLIQFGFNTGIINITHFSPHGEKIPVLPTTNFRYIIVSELARLAHPNVNWANYNEVIAITNVAN